MAQIDEVADPETPAGAPSDGQDSKPPGISDLDKLRSLREEILAGKHHGYSVPQQDPAPSQTVDPTDSFPQQQAAPESTDQSVKGDDAPSQLPDGPQDGADAVPPTTQDVPTWGPLVTEEPVPGLETQVDAGQTPLSAYSDSAQDRPRYRDHAKADRDFRNATQPPSKPPVQSRPSREPRRTRDHYETGDAPQRRRSRSPPRRRPRLDEHASPDVPYMSSSTPSSAVYRPAPGMSAHEDPYSRYHDRPAPEYARGPQTTMTPYPPRPDVGYPLEHEQAYGGDPRVFQQRGGPPAPPPAMDPRAADYYTQAQSQYSSGGQPPMQHPGYYNAAPETTAPPFMQEQEPPRRLLDRLQQRSDSRMQRDDDPRSASSYRPASPRSFVGTPSLAERLEAGGRPPMASAGHFQTPVRGSAQSLSERIGSRGPPSRLPLDRSQGRGRPGRGGGVSAADRYRPGENSGRRSPSHQSLEHRLGPATAVPSEAYRAGPAPPRAGYPEEMAYPQTAPLQQSQSRPMDAYRYQSQTSMDVHRAGGYRRDVAPETPYEQRGDVLAQDPRMAGGYSAPRDPSYPYTDPRMAYGPDLGAQSAPINSYDYGANQDPRYAAPYPPAQPDFRGSMGPPSSDSYPSRGYDERDLSRANAAAAYRGAGRGRDRPSSGGGYPGGQPTPTNRGMNGGGGPRYRQQ